MRQDVLTTIAFLTEQYSTEQHAADLSDGQLDFWLESLEQYSAEVLRKAAVRSIRQSKWLPKLAEFIQLCEQEYEGSDQRKLDIFYQAMELSSRQLRGEITDEQLVGESAYRWWQRKQAVDMDAYAEARERSDAEVRQWMLEPAGV